MAENPQGSRTLRQSPLSQVMKVTPPPFYISLLKPQTISLAVDLGSCQDGLMGKGKRKQPSPLREELRELVCLALKTG